MNYRTRGQIVVFEDFGSWSWPGRLAEEPNPSKQTFREIDRSQYNAKVCEQVSIH